MGNLLKLGLFGVLPSPLFFVTCPPKWVDNLNCGGRLASLAFWSVPRIGPPRVSPSARQYSQEWLAYRIDLRSLVA